MGDDVITCSLELIAPLMNRAMLRCLGLAALIPCAGCGQAGASGGETLTPKTIHVRFVGERGWTFAGELERDEPLPDCGSDSENVGVVARSVRVGNYAGCVLVVDWPGREAQTRARFAPNGGK